MTHRLSRAAACLAVLLAAAPPALANPETTLSLDAAAAEIGGARVNGLAMTLEGRYSSGFHYGIGLSRLGDRTAAVDTIGARTGFRLGGVGPVISVARASMGGVSEDRAMVGIDSRHEIRDVVLRTELLSNVRRFGQDYRAGAGIDLEIGSGLTLNGALVHERVGPSQTNALSAGVTWRAFDALDLRAALGVSRASGSIDGRSISVGTAFRL